VVPGRDHDTRLNSSENFSASLRTRAARSGWIMLLIYPMSMPACAVFLKVMNSLSETLILSFEAKPLKLAGLGRRVCCYS
jgi:hypothetical protein